MTAREIQRKLMAERFRRAFVLPNYTPRGWFECDVFEVTKSGYFREYEVKVSRGDFFADSEKENKCWRSKHELIEAGDQFGAPPAGPTRFWFVVPGTVDGQGFHPIVADGEVPAWAGLVVAYRGSRSVHLHEVRKAPELHRVKLAPDRLAHAKGVTYWRFLRMYLKRKENE